MSTTADMNPSTAPMSVICNVDSRFSTDGVEFPQTDANKAGPHSERRSSSEEKDGLTPAQNRRKAQNRAAQRAFRERKEKHVKDLEARLSELETSASVLASDNQRLKLALQRATTENEILRATSRPNSIYGISHPLSPNPNEQSDQTDYSYNSTGSGQSPDGGDVLLPASATWDLIQGHPLVRQGFVDIADVCERLRGAARCDGSGPVFAERVVRRAIEESKRAGGDELI
ncbi:hypothetical protein, variant [Verruconis gallopava]|nr:hypothetical protein, variant [Verruconis gallopava]KIW07475.1 hypothetical protein, variant [Verruconis gallopava]